MIGLLLKPDCVIKQEQYQDLLHQAEHQRLIKAALQPESRCLPKQPGGLRRPMARLDRYLPNFRPIGWVRI
jgi:hypothetical protein